MAIIYEETLKKQISTSDFSPVYIIFGDDGFLKKNYVDKITAKTADKNDIFNYSRFEADCDLQEVYDSLSQLPVMADKKCVVLCDFDFEHCPKSDFDKLCMLAADTNETSIFIIWFDSYQFDYKKSAKFKKLSSFVEKGRGSVALLDHKRIAELAKMVSDGATKRGCTMDLAVARYLVETVGEDINTIKNETDKLCYFIQSGNITKKDIDYVCLKTTEASVYNISKQVLACNTDAALNILNDLFFERIEPMAIFYAISSVYIDTYRLYICKKNQKSVHEAAVVFGYKNREFVLERAAQNLSKLNYKKLELSFDALIDADSKLKSFGSDSRVVLEQLIIRLIYIIAKGEVVDKA